MSSHGASYQKAPPFRGLEGHLGDLRGQVRVCLLQPGYGAVAEASHQCHQGVEVLQLEEFLAGGTSDVG